MSPLVGVVTSSSGSSSSSQKTEDSARRHIASELLQTEKNFVEILDTIVKVYILFMHEQLQGSLSILKAPKMEMIALNA